MKNAKRFITAVLMIALMGVMCFGTSNISLAAKMKISKSKATLKQGQSFQLKVASSKGKVKWSVNNDNVKLNKTSGKKVKVTAVKAGKSVVKVKASGKTLKCNVTVNGLTIVKKSLFVGESFTLQAKGLGKKIKWSANGKAVTVKGKKAKATVTAKEEGKATVIAKVGKKKYKCVVTVSAREVELIPVVRPVTPPVDIPVINPENPLDKVDFIVEVESGKEPVVLQLTDPQIIDPEQVRYETRISDGEKAYWSRENRDIRLYDSLRETVEATNPDLILITGDLIYGEFDDDGTALLDLIEVMESFEIPWAPVFGNHDQESAMGADWQCEQLENAEYCLFKQRELTGNGNYTVGIKQDGLLKRVFFMLDSNGCGTAHANSLANGHTQTGVGFAQDQVTWFVETGNEIKELSPSTQITFAFHIQFMEFNNAYRKYGFTNSGTKENPINIDKLDNKEDGDFGYLGRDLKGAWDHGRSVFNRMKALGTDSILVGHEHCNSASVVYDGIRFQFGQKLGTYDRANFVTEEGAITGGYCLDLSNTSLEPMSGGTVMKLSADDASIIDAYIYLSGDAQAKLDGTYEEEPEEPEVTIPVNGLQKTDFTGDGAMAAIEAVAIAEENAWKFDSANGQGKVYLDLDLLEGKKTFTFAVYVPETSTKKMSLPTNPEFTIRVKPNGSEPTGDGNVNGYIEFSTTNTNEDYKLQFNTWQTFTIDISGLDATCTEFAFNIGEGNVIYVRDMAFGE